MFAPATKLVPMVMDWSATTFNLLKPKGDAEPAIMPALFTSSSNASLNSVAFNTFFNFNFIDFYIATDNHKYQFSVRYIKNCF